MTAPDLGPCQCEVTYRENGFAYEHEHSDFEPHGCTFEDCPCRAWQAPRDGTETAENRAQINADGSTTGSAGVRKGVTLPADLGFARERVETVAAWLDEVTQTVRANGVSDAADPYAVCALADLLEEHTPEGIDPLDALALAIRRQATRTTTAREAWESMRRKVRR